MRNTGFVLMIAVFIAPAAARAVECPTLPADGDWDGDGVLNGVDECCFVATLPDPDGVVT
jgi:hypothetical protein